MRIAPWWLAGLVLAVAGYSQTPTKKLTSEDYRQMVDDEAYWDAQYRRYADIGKRALELYPGRRNTPLRELNISDNEVREVQAISNRYLPRAIVNISPVVTDCPCEEGPTCTAQVYVLATSKDKTRGLQLSRMNDRWAVGMVQDWWLRYEAIVRQHTGNAMLDDYLYRKATSELYEEFPRCVGQLVPAPQAASTKKPEGKK
jgi:hypothetical protein